MSDERGERFHRGIATMEKMYQEKVPSSIYLQATEFSWISLSLYRSKKIQQEKNLENLKNDRSPKIRPYGRKRMMDSDSATSVQPNVVITVLVPEKKIGSVGLCNRQIIKNIDQIGRPIWNRCMTFCNRV